MLQSFFYHKKQASIQDKLGMVVVDIGVVGLYKPLKLRQGETSQSQ